MVQVFSKSCIGYSHILKQKPCQDFSSRYVDPKRIIITCCDGHGGDMYVRSDRGSAYASCALINVFSSISKITTKMCSNDELVNKIRLEILCEWNKLVERELGTFPLRKKEVEFLDDDKKEFLKLNPVKAFGTTLSGALLIGNKLILASIGDTEVIGIRKGEIISLLSSEDDPAGNITYSMCQEDAYDYLRVEVHDFNDYDGIILCTDGLTSPYQTYENFKDSFVKPLVNKIINDESINSIDAFIEDLAMNKGVGDDVSLSFIIKDNAFKKYYS